MHVISYQVLGWCENRPRPLGMTCELILISFAPQEGVTGGGMSTDGRSLLLGLSSGRLVSVNIETQDTKVLAHDSQTAVHVCSFLLFCHAYEVT